MTVRNEQAGPLGGELQETPDVLPQTASQTVGPFFHYGLIFPGDEVLTSEGTRGERIELSGLVLDGNGDPVPDAMLEIWQADAGGHFNHPADPGSSEADPAFRGFGRSQTDDSGRYRFETIKPGAISWQGRSYAPHINMRVFARGMLIHLVTRVFFDDEPGNEADDLLASVPADRRPTLIARREEEVAGGARYRFDIRLQGDGETVFLEP